MAVTLSESYQACREVMEAASRSFTFATRLLPGDVRPSTYALYAMFRILDDLVDGRDEQLLSVVEARDQLAQWRLWFLAEMPHGRPEPIVPAFREVITRHSVPPAVFLDLVSALDDDLNQRRYQTMSELIRYCYGVASTVGVAMCHVLGAPDRQACARAAEMGVAMQLTNILRDVGEDLSLGRIYLPAEDLRAFAVSEADLQARTVTPGYKLLAQSLASIAEGYYQSGLHGIALLPRRVRFGIGASALLYRDILRVARRNDWDTLNRRATTGKPRKLVLAAQALVARPPGSAGSAPPGLPSGEELLRAEEEMPVREASALSN